MSHFDYRREAAKRATGEVTDPLWRDVDAHDPGNLAGYKVGVLMDRADAMFLQSMLVKERARQQRERNQEGGHANREVSSAHAKVQRLSRLSSAVLGVLKASPRPSDQGSSSSTVRPENSTRRTG